MFWTCGVKVTLIVQKAPTARELPQSFDSAKSPLVTILEIVTGLRVVLVTVTFCGGLVVPGA